MDIAAEPDDLSERALASDLPGRPIRSYPALLATGADAVAWARAGAPEGALVVADYQASPRGRAGLEWTVQPGVGLGFSLVLRPPLPPEREGWLYTVVICALTDVLGEQAIVEWPDEVRRGDSRAAAVGIEVELGPERVEWAVANVLIPGSRPPRAPLLRRVLTAIEDRCHEDAEGVLADYRRRCATLGRRVRARLIPLGPAGPQVTGKAVDCRANGALVVETTAGRRVAVLPQYLGVLENAPAE